MIMHILHNETSTARPGRKKGNRRKRTGRRNKGNGSGRIPPVFSPKTSGNGNQTFARKKKEKKSYSLPQIAPWKIILASFIIGICGVLYISHVFQTQQLLKEVKSLEQQYQRSQRMHEKHELQYERMTGPRQIYQKAQENGFVSGGPVEKVISIEE